MAEAGQPERLQRIQGGHRNRHTVRFDDAQQARIEAAAAAAGVSIPRLIAETTHAALDGDGQRIPLAERRALVREITRTHGALRAIGTNVNQLAARANAGGIPAQEEITATMRLIWRVSARFGQVLERLAPGPPGSGADR